MSCRREGSKRVYWVEKRVSCNSEKLFSHIGHDELKQFNRVQKDILSNSCQWDVAMEESDLYTGAKYQERQ